MANDVFEAKMELTQIETGLTMQRCVDAPLMVNRRTMKQQFVQSIFELLKRFCNLVNVGRNFNEDQMIQMSFDLYERFCCESLEDVALFFKMARNGEFGEFYRLDSTVMMKWVDAYLDQKAQALEAEIRNRENIRRRQENDAVANHVPDEKAKEKLKELTKRVAGFGARKTGTVNRENPLFNYDTFCKNLEQYADKMPDAELAVMLKNTSRNSHPKVWEILNTENELRKQQKRKK